MDNAESEPVKLKAATEILDRAGIRAGIDINTDITLDVRPAASIIAERLQRIASNAIEAQQRMAEVEAQQQSIIVEEPVDAEVVEEDATKPETE
jgi:hypothetical protein